ncbi:MAG: iron-containing redox enzyme family protein [Blastocatellia bacterium]|nr:iron-containing redox enzyme family protein [Blastocatellia bacterium]
MMSEDNRCVRSQRDMFLANRERLGPQSYEELISYEAVWMDKLLSPLTDQSVGVQSFEQFRGLLKELIEKESDNPPLSAIFLAQEMSLKQFKGLVEQFAVDGLTEAQAFPAIIPRLPIRAQMPIQRILIDEFGCGNLEQMHTYLYCLLLEELGSPLDLDYFVGIAIDPVFEFVNVFHWMTKRAPDVEYFLGALSWFEGVVPIFFKPYVEACDRLGIKAHHYFSEHIHIDHYHAQSALLAIREAAKSVPIDYKKVWVGAQLAQLVAGQAFDAAVELTRGGESASTTKTFRLRVDDQEYLVPMECSHRKGWLRNGKVNRTRQGKCFLVCPLHFSTFDLQTGKRVSGPAARDLTIVKLPEKVGQNPDC